MRRFNNPKIQAAQWFLEFISEDLDSLSDLNFSKRILEAQHYFTEPIPMLSWMAPGRSDWKPIGWPDRKHQNKEKQFSPRFNYPWKDYLRYVQSDLRGFLQKIVTPIDDFTKRQEIQIFEGKVVVIFGPLPGGEMRLGFAFPDYFRDIFSEKLYDLSIMAQMAEISFSLSLDGIPDLIDVIKTCKECGRYFLHLSKKPRIFCTSKCTSRAISRRRREADPEGYRLAQREIMRRKYRELKAKEIGVPAEKVKIQKKSSPKLTTKGKQ